MPQFAPYTKRTLLGESSTAGTTGITAEVDMQNWTGVFFWGNIGTTAAGAHTLAGLIGASTTDTFVAISGATKASTAGNDTVELDIYKPAERWVQATFTSTAATEKTLLAIQYGPRNLQANTTNVTLVVGSAT